MATNDIAKIAVESYPCDGCAFISYCASEPAACRAFALYVRASKKWRQAPRDPSRLWFVAIMSSDGELQRELNEAA